MPAARKPLPPSKLGKFVRYSSRVYPVLRELATVPDQRVRPQIPTADVLRGLLFTAVLRLPSLNALEGELKRPGFQRLLGRVVQHGRKVFSADTAARVLDSVACEGLRASLRGLVHKAERNKVLREGPVGARRAVAIDGWELFHSGKRSCSECLHRRVRQGDQLVVQHYHRAAVAMLLSDEVELVLDFEPLRNLDRRRQDGEDVDAHDGEQTAALRLIERLHLDYGSLIDLFVLDGLYPNGPVMAAITGLGYGAIITAKKATDEPLKDALAIMAGQPSSRQWFNPEKKEHLEAWDVDDIETLDTFKGKVRVVRVEVASARTGRSHTWCAAVIGDRARTLPVEEVHRLQRMRWHEENTLFNQWTQQWNLGHPFRHKPNAVPAVLLLWCLAFNLMQLFVYRRLRRPRKPQDPCDSIRSIVAEIHDDVRGLTGPIPWPRLLLFSG